MRVVAGITKRPARASTIYAASTLVNLRSRAPEVFVGIVKIHWTRSSLRRAVQKIKGKNAVLQMPFQRWEFGVRTVAGRVACGQL